MLSAVRIAILGDGLDPSARALIARMAVQPTPARRMLINATIKSLKRAGVWTKLAVLWVTAAHDAQAARLNWIGDRATLIPSNSPIFTADRGFKGDGSAAALISTVQIPLPANSAHIGGWSRTSSLGAYPIISDAALATSYLIPQRLASTMRGRASSVALGDAALATSSGAGHSVFSRTDSVNMSGYRDGLLRGTIANAGTATSPAFRLLGGGSSFSPDEVALGHAGLGLTPGETATLHAIFLTYLQSVGAA